MVAAPLVGPARAADPVVVDVTVTTDAPLAGCDDGAGGTSLREALCQAEGLAPGPVLVRVPAGTHLLTAGALTVDPQAPLDLTVQGVGAVVDAGGASRVLDLDPTLTGGLDVTVEGLTLTGGAAGPDELGGGAVIAGSGDAGSPDSLTLRDCVLEGNGTTGGPTDAGGAVSMTGGVLLVERCTFTGNTSHGAGGAAIAFTGVDGGADTVTVRDSVVQGSTATGGSGVVGGAVDVSWGTPTVTVDGSRFVGNTVTSTSGSPAQGAALRVAAGTATITGTAVLDNVVTGPAGSAAALWLAAGTVADSRVAGNLTNGVRDGLHGAASALRTWWGCTEPAVGTGCDAAGGATILPAATLVAAADPSTAVAGAGVDVTVGLALTDGAAPTAALLGTFVDAPVAWGGAATTVADATLDATGSAAATFTMPASDVTLTGAVDGAAAGASVQLQTPPAVTVAPQSVTVDAGDDATFTVTVTGAPAPTLDWQRRATPTSPWVSTGETGAGLTLAGVSPGDDGVQVRVVATNAVGSATSAPATLTVHHGPSSVTDPDDVRGLAGDEVTFTTSAVGNPAPTVRWESSPDGTTWTPVDGATSATYTRTLGPGDDGLRVRAVHTGATGEVATAAAVVTLDEVPAVTVDPQGATVDAGDDATFTVTVTGAPAPTLDWQRRATPTSPWVSTGETGTSLALAGVAPGDDGTQVRVVATNAVGAATSAPATLTVHHGPSSVTDPDDVRGLAGDDVTFTTSSAGNPAPTVRWETSPDGTAWTPVAGATSATYTRTLGPGDDGLRVRAVHTGATGEVATAAAVVTLDEVPAVTVDPQGATVDAGDDATFTVTVTGTPTPALRWQHDADGAWADVVGATGTSLTVTGADQLHGVRYRAVAANVHGTATSAPATLTVLVPPTVSTPRDIHAPPGAAPGEIGTAPGRDVLLGVDVTGRGRDGDVLGVTWQTSADGVTWDAAGSGPRLTLTPTAEDDGLLVRATATATLVGGPVSVTSGTAIVRVAEPPQVVDPAPPVVAARAGLPVTLAWEVLAADATVAWSVSRDDGTTWGPTPLGWTLTATPGADVLGVAAAAVPVRTVHAATFTPTAADDGLVVRLQVTTAGGLVTLTSAVDVAAAPTDPDPTEPSPTDPDPAAPGGDGTGGGLPGGSSAGPGRLPDTGADVLAVLALGALLTLGGAAAVRVARAGRRTA
ncbi:immunoglobulin I-set domain protein [Cellulomonas sp. SLBN-39]|nr:immunoglobulin I-set domain protein [Cellulomonas sp. SLBN-39]